MEQKTAHLNQIAMRIATNACLQVLQVLQVLLVLLLLLANQKIAPARLVIRAPICALLRRVVSIRQVGMITVLAGRDIELMGWRQRIRSSLDWPSRDRSIGCLLHQV
jgi:hypothetical protein